jgi:hypothetical protein
MSHVNVSYLFIYLLIYLFILLVFLSSVLSFFLSFFLPFFLSSHVFLYAYFRLSLVTLYQQHFCIIYGKLGKCDKKRSWPIFRHRPEVRVCMSVRSRSSDRNSKCGTVRHGVAVRFLWDLEFSPRLACLVWGVLPKVGVIHCFRSNWMRRCRGPTVYTRSGLKSTMRCPPGHSNWAPTQH